MATFSSQEVQMKYNMDNLDIDRFIIEMKNRPALWDFTSKEYANKMLKAKCWDQIIELFIEDKSAPLLDKMEFGKILQRRWKSLRDCYSREIQRTKKKGSAAMRRSTYKHFKQLSFLHRFIRVKNNKVKVKNETNDEENNELSDVNSAKSISISKPEKRNKLTIEEKILEVLEKGREQNMAEDDDRMFLLSLLKPLKCIHESQRFAVRMQLMNVINNALPNNYNTYSPCGRVEVQPLDMLPGYTKN